MNKFCLLILGLMLLGCKKEINCNEIQSIEIENRWNVENGGIKNLTLKDKNDIAFICNRIKYFPKGKHILVGYSYGEIEMYINNLKIEGIFTYRYGVVYRVSPGMYVPDEKLTQKLIELMKIKKPYWGVDCP